MGAGNGSLWGTHGAMIGTVAPTGVGLMAKLAANALAKRDLYKAAELMRQAPRLFIKSALQIHRCQSSHLMLSLPAPLSP